MRCSVAQATETDFKEDVNRIAVSLCQSRGRLSGRARMTHGDTGRQHYPKNKPRPSGLESTAKGGLVWGMCPTALLGSHGCPKLAKLFCIAMWKFALGKNCRLAASLVQTSLHAERRLRVSVMLCGSLHLGKAAGLLQVWCRQVCIQRGECNLRSRKTLLAHFEGVGPWHRRQRR